MSTTLEAIEALKAIFPLFTYKEAEKGYICVDENGLGSTWIKDSLPANVMESLAIDHKRMTVKKEWEDKFPHLCFHVTRGADRPSDVWVKRGGRDADGIPYSFYKHAPNYPSKSTATILKELAVWEEKAKLATQEGWFLCFICGEPKPHSEYGYYHFCANYCKDCLKSHPDVERSARNENYE